MEETNYIIGICCTDADGVKLFKTCGTKEEIKNLLVNCVKKDRQNDEEGWDYGCESTAEVTEEENGCLNAYATYHDYHIDYTAIPEDKIPILAC